MVIALIFGCFVWYSSRPKLWNSRDITATFSSPMYKVDDNFEYLLTLHLNTLLTTEHRRTSRSHRSNPFSCKMAGR